MGRFRVLTAIGLFLFTLVFSMGAFAAEKNITIKWWINPWRIEPPGFPAGKAPTADDFPKWASEAFMKLHPNVKVEYEVIPNQGFDEKIAAAILGRSQPDVIRGFNKQWATRGLLEPIDDYLTPADRADFYQYALDEGKVNGRYYLFPWNNSNNGMGSALLLNPELFKAAGVAMPALPNRSWTVNEFLAAARKLTRDLNGDGQTDQYAISFAASDLINNVGWMYVHGAEMFNANETALTINSQKGVNGLQFMVDLINKERVAPKGAEGMGIYDVIGLFHQKKTAIGYGGPYEIGRIDRYVKEGQLKEVFTVHIAQFPHLPEVGPVAYHTSGGFAVFKQSDPYKRQMALEFARFLTNAENTRLLKSLLYVTARKSVNADLYKGSVFEKEIDVYTRAIENGKRYFGSADIDFVPLEKHLQAAFEAAFSGTKTPKKALDDFVSTGNRLIKRR